MPVMLMAGDTIIGGEMMNMSIGGLRMESEQPLTDGMKVTVSIPGMPVMDGIVLRSGPPASVKFENMSDSDREEVADFLQTMIVQQQTAEVLEHYEADEELSEWIDDWMTA